MYSIGYVEHLVQWSGFSMHSSQGELHWIHSYKALNMKPVSHSVHSVEAEPSHFRQAKKIN